jgi:hypothetical protein
MFLAHVGQSPKIRFSSFLNFVFIGRRAAHVFCLEILLAQVLIFLQSSTQLPGLKSWSRLNCSARLHQSFIFSQYIPAPLSVLVRVSSTFSSPRNDFAASAAAPSPPVFQSKLAPWSGASFARRSVDSSFVRPLLVITLFLCVDLLRWLFDLSLWIACVVAG